MSDDATDQPAGGQHSPFEQIKRVNTAGNEHWSSRDFARVLGYSDYRNFEQVIDKAKIACFNSGQRLDDHFVDITDMIEIGSGVGCASAHLLQTWCAKAHPTELPISA